MQTPVEVLSQADVERLLAAPDRADVHGLRDAAVLATMYYAGANAREVTNLNLGDIERRRQQIMLRGDAGAKHRVKIAAELGEILSAYRDRSRRLLLAHLPAEAQKIDAYFLGNKGQRLRVQEVRQILGANLKAAGITATVNFNTLRLSRAWHLREAGVEPGRIQRFLGAEGRSGRRVI